MDTHLERDRVREMVERAFESFLNIVRAPSPDFKKLTEAMEDVDEIEMPLGLLMELDGGRDSFLEKVQKRVSTFEPSCALLGIPQLLVVLAGQFQTSIASLLQALGFNVQEKNEQELIILLFAKNHIDLDKAWQYIAEWAILIQALQIDIDDVGLDNLTNWLKATFFSRDVDPWYCTPGITGSNDTQLLEVDYAKLHEEIVSLAYEIVAQMDVQ